jgi:excinuclease ABC subunit A
MDIIKVADHIIDLGPEGGDRGGRIVAEGTPEQIIKIKKSYTGQALSSVLKTKSKQKPKAKNKSKAKS